MNESFTSVLLFYTALKTFFTDTLGWTVDRNVATHDDILTNGAGVFVRLRRKTNGSTTAVGLELGSDPDSLELSTADAELVLPFDTASGGLFQANVNWYAEAERLEVAVLASGDRWSKRYYVGLTVRPAMLTVEHRDHLNHALEPNFKVRSGPYIQAGA